MKIRKEKTGKRSKKRVIKNLITEVNQSLVWYKGGCWIDVKRTPTSKVNLVENLEEFVEARFNRECFDIPELKDIFDKFDGKVWKCKLTEPDEEKRRFKWAEVYLPSSRQNFIDSQGNDIPEEEIEDLFNIIQEYFGGNTLTFNGVRQKIKFSVELKIKEND